VVKRAGEPLAFDWRWRVLMALIAPWFVLARWRIDVRGLDQLPREGGAVIAFNHHGYADAVMLAWGVVLKGGRPLRFLAKREACEGRWIGWVTRWISAIPVDRASSGARANALSAAEVALVDGDLVAVAPEQTISDSLELLPFRLGAARLAIAAGVPIVPCVGWGSHRFVGPARRLDRVLRLPVTVHFDAPLWPSPGEDALQLTRRLEERMASVLEEVQRTYPDGLPAGADWVPARLGGSARPHDAVLAEHARRVRDWGERLPDAGRGPVDAAADRDGEDAAPDADADRGAGA
jgi:1-acyl-sn-glycerol-3-phosphate acyltransferase